MSFFDHFLFQVVGSSCVDWIGFDGSLLYVRHTNWKKEHQPYDHAYVYPCSLDQFNRLLTADSIGAYYNRWFRFVYSTQHGTFRDLQFTFETAYDMATVETGLPKTAGAFEPLQFYSRVTGNTAFEDVQLLAIVPSFYPGATLLEYDRVSGVYGVPLACDVFLQNVQARVMMFHVDSLICSIVAIEQYLPVHGTLNNSGLCLLHIPAILEVRR